MKLWPNLPEYYFHSSLYLWNFIKFASSFLPLNPVTIHGGNGDKNVRKAEQDIGNGENPGVNNFIVAKSAKFPCQSKRDQEYVTYVKRR